MERRLRLKKESTKESVFAIPTRTDESPLRKWFLLLEGVSMSSINHVRNFLLEKLLMHFGEKLGIAPKGTGRVAIAGAVMAATPARFYVAAGRGSLRAAYSLVGRFHTPHVKSGSKPSFTSKLDRPGAGGRSQSISVKGTGRNYGIRRIGGGPPLGVSAGSLGLGLMILAPVSGMLHDRRTSSLEYHR